MEAAVAFEAHWQRAPYVVNAQWRHRGKSTVVVESIEKRGSLQALVELVGKQGCLRPHVDFLAERG